MKILRGRRVERGVYHELVFDLPSGNYYVFPCDEHGDVDGSQLHPVARENLAWCRAASVEGKDCVARGVRTTPYCHVEPAVAECDLCKGEAEFHRHCGCFVCHRCDNHLGLARCYCGWSASGGDGRRELAEMGEPTNEEP